MRAAEGGGAGVSSVAPLTAAHSPFAQSSVSSSWGRVTTRPTLSGEMSVKLSTTSPHLVDAVAEAAAAVAAADAASLGRALSKRGKPERRLVHRWTVAELTCSRHQGQR